MLLQLNRQTEIRAFTATATDLPVNPAHLPAGPRPVVAVLGRPSRVAGLDRHLPDGWVVRQAAGLDDVRPGELVLLAGATGDDTGLARRVLPARTPIIAVVDDTAQPGLVADVLTAGADACVRGGQPGILAGHLVACRRRLVADRWTGLNQQNRL
jgi:hypothetical protein